MRYKVYKAKDPHDYDAAMNTAMNILSYSPRTQHELETKLAEREYVPDIIHQVVERCKEIQVLNDETYAWERAQNKSEHQHWGSYRIRQDLKTKGIPDNILNLVVEHYQTLDEPNAYRVAEKRYDPRKDPTKETKRLVSHLAYKGYPASIAYAAAKDVIQQYSEISQTALCSGNEHHPL